MSRKRGKHQVRNFEKIKVNTFERHSVLLDLLDVHSKLIFGGNESEMEIKNGENKMKGK